MCGASAARLTKQLLAAVVLDGQRIFERRIGGAAQFGQLRLDRQLGGQFLGQRHVDRQRDLRGAALRGNGERVRADRRALGNVEPQIERDAVIGGRHGGGDRLAAAEQRGGPALRHAIDREREPLRRETVIAQLQTDGRGGAGLDRDRRIIGQQIKALDVGSRVGCECRNRKSEKRGSECKQTMCHGQTPFGAARGPDKIVTPLNEARPAP